MYWLALLRCSFLLHWMRSVSCHWKGESAFLFILSCMSPPASFHCICSWCDYIVYLDQLICLTEDGSTPKLRWIFWCWSDFLGSHTSRQGRAGGNTWPGWGRTVNFRQQPTVCSVLQPHIRVEGRAAISERGWVWLSKMCILVSQ